MDDPFQTLLPEPIRVETTAPEHPQRIGRYRVERVLGQGGFGIVYLAQDDQLQRPVAIKVPHPHLVSCSEDAEAYLTEARTVASLDHPHIVPVYDVGSSEQFPCFVVSKYIEGSTLAQKIKDARPGVVEAVELVATVAETLHYAHRKGLVHRDIKPGNILLDTSGEPYVADFGLALREADVGKGSRYAGTPAYMSPEQARGEGHRVDGRSDLFSLGVVFYELLSGRRPFKADSMDELLEQVKDIEVRPPRQWDDSIPKELERICMKALAKRASDRYSTGKDMAEDLRHFFQNVTEDEKQSLRFNVPAAHVPSSAPAETPVPSRAVTPAPDSGPIRIVPKGLRSFDAYDADFFLELLPGPRDREGVPDSIRFWKTRIEERDADNTFAVGLIYGPSGCGKSSLVKAGLLPCLSSNIIAVYIEATAAETETRLLNGLRKRCPALPANLGLNETLAVLRRGQGVPAGQKVLIVLDQFEQWLHAKKEEENTELVQALRQCDGSRLQCIVLVRDDFWMAATRFMRELEIRLLEGQNSAAVDLFPLRHAEKVLEAFGRAFGVLTGPSTDLSKDQKSFVQYAVSGLAQEGKVISVRLALFAEMMKGKSWTPAILKEMGGTEGVGMTFLEETFSATSAPPEHRYHQKAARAVLKALLPDSGTEIKGHMRSHAELLAESGYTNRPKDFEDLLLILDGEIRLLTPTDPEGKEESDPVPVHAGAKYYQLTHDYLVPVLRSWLTRKQKESRRGRAELLLADRAVVWNARSENRQLPSLLQWLQIRWLTRKKTWTASQRKMMDKATRYHALRGLMTAFLLTLVGWGVYEGNGRLEAHALRSRLLDAKTSEVPAIVQDMAPYRRWLDPLLREAYVQATQDNDRRKQLHVSLALLAVDAAQVDYLADRLLDAEPNEVPILRDALAVHREILAERFWVVVRRPKKGHETQRLRAAAALAKYDPDSPRWQGVREKVMADLVSVNSIHLGIWSEAFRPVRSRMLEPLAAICREHSSKRATERTLATNLLADYASDNPQVLSDLLMDADDKQFAVLYSKLAEQREQTLPLLTAEIERRVPPDLPSSDPQRDVLAKRQANAAVALLRLNQPDKVWPLLRHSRDPRVRSYLIHRFGLMGAGAEVLIKRLEDEPDVTIRRALILSLGPEEFGEQALRPEQKQRLLERLKEFYRTTDDPGLNAAAEWLLRQWHEESWLAQTDRTWARDTEWCEKRLAAVREELHNPMGRKGPQWYMTALGHKMVVLPGPVEFTMGSPLTEIGRFVGEEQYQKRVSRTFAIANKPVTLDQYLLFDKDHLKLHVKMLAPTGDCPAHRVTWHRAAAYCNWLSEQERIPKSQWCYETDERGQVTSVKEKYLSLEGYRLPTEAEMEYACRAGAATSRYYGESEELLAKYAWYALNAMDRSWPVASKKPNDFGFFDMHGNVWCWCQEPFKPYPQRHHGVAFEDLEDKLKVDNQEPRSLRNGSYVYQPANVRSALRLSHVPTYVFGDIGFRPARTFR